MKISKCKLIYTIQYSSYPSILFRRHLLRAINKQVILESSKVKCFDLNSLELSNKRYTYSFKFLSFLDNRMLPGYNLRHCLSMVMNHIK